jgi:radical SAM superfamily enzyme YgiQ (UPF0313 family)
MSKKLLLFGLHKGPILPLGLGYIAAYLKKYLDYENVAIELSETGSLEDVMRQHPDIVGFTSVTRDYNKVVALAREVKLNLGIPTLLGGHHITPIPQTLPNSFDVAVLGEGEQTMLELMRLFSGTGDLDPRELESIAGIAFHESGEVKVTAPRELIDPMDGIPFPARELFGMKKFTHPVYDWSFFEPMRVTSISSSRGCPYSCVYCSSAAFWKKYRFFSADYVVEEIRDVLRRYEVDGIMIADDLFIGNKERLRRIVRLITEAGIEKRVKFWVNGRANLLDEEVCSLLEQMNVFHLGLGFESASESVLGFLKSGTVSVDQNKRALTLAKKYEFDVEGCFIVGSPGETEEDMLRTYDFIRRSAIDSFGVQVMTPLPGTTIWQMAKDRDLVGEDMDFDLLYDFNPINYIDDYDRHKDLLMTEELSKDDFLRIYRKFQVLQLKRGRYNRLKLSRLFSKVFWKTAFGDPKILWRAVKFSLVGYVFAFPSLWRLHQKVKRIRERPSTNVEISQGS